MTYINMFDTSAIRKKRKELKLSAPQLADLLKVSLQNLYKWEKGTKPSDPEDYIKIDSWLSGKLEIVPNHTNTEPLKQEAIAIQTGEINPQQLVEAIITLTRNNEKVIDTNARMALTNDKIADTNKVLANKLVSLNEANEYDQPEIPEALESRISDVLELIAELGTGKRWKSYGAALEEISKRIHGNVKKRKAKSIHVGVNK